MSHMLLFIEEFCFGLHRHYSVLIETTSMFRNAKPVEMVDLLMYFHLFCSFVTTNLLSILQLLILIWIKIRIGNWNNSIGIR